MEESPSAWSRSAADGAKSKWTYQVIHDPVGRSGYGSAGSLIVDASGSFISSGGGGPKRGGTVFRLSPLTQSEPKWKPQLLAGFPADSALTNPLGPLTPGLIVDVAGDVLGTTYQGGPNDGGILYEFTP